MANTGFTHLHLHTQYSLLDGAVAPDKLFARCKELGMDSVAITDHGNMYGAIDFYLKAQAAGIKPIIGIEAYLAGDSRKSREKDQFGETAYHLILLAENTTGYHNLLKLSTLSYTEGFYYKPRVDKEILAEHSDGIICTSACIAGEVARAVEKGDLERAVEMAKSYRDIFGENNFFVEIQDHTGTDLPDIRGEMVEVAKKAGVGVVATNDVHFLNAEDHEAHDALTCISTGKRVTDENRMIYPKSLYLKSPEEMREQFAKTPEACDNTLAIAERCNVEIDLDSQHAPVYTPKDGSTPEEMFRKLVYDGAKEKYGEITSEIEDRLEREIDVIAGKGFASYFLINWDFCNYARENHIPVGARGSAVGTAVGYCMGICDVDPLKYDLLFERFMDPERNEMPDIDIDICQDGRQKVLEYVRDKYGDIAQITTFGTMKAKAVVRDVCRVLDVPLGEADRLAKLIPNDLKMTLDKALEAEPELKEGYNTDPQTRKVFDIGRKLEGLTRHASVHACGVVIADEPLANFLPLYKTGDSDEMITQYEGPWVEKAGLLKMDFLGLRTLSIIERAVQLVKDAHGVEIDPEKVDITDQRVFNEVFGSGKTKGVFQFESGGMQDLLMKLKPDRLEDLIAANALYRPGPMALIPDYIKRKHGADWEVPHPIMREVLEETFGIMVYQEQVMRICNRLGDIKLRAAYTLIKAIGKKKLKVIAQAKEQFVKGCVSKGLTEEQANEIFDLIEKFAGYGFNKSHATRYSFVAYQTAYLKTYYPVEFMAALLTYEQGNTDKIVDYIDECKSMGISVLPPDINESFSDFTVVYNEDESGEKKGNIRFGLGAVKGVGLKAVEQMIETRERVGKFKSLYHFCENVDLRAVNKQVIDSLIKAGAFDQLSGSRAQMIAGLEHAMQAGAQMQADVQSGQMNFFGAGGFAGNGEEDRKDEHLPNVPPWPEMQMLKYEKDVLGFYVTSNPLSKHAQELRAYSNTNTAGLKQRKEGSEVVVGGMVKSIRNIVTKNGRNAGAKMAVFVLEDLHGTCEVVLFPKTYERIGHLAEVDKVLFVKGTVDTSRENPNVLCDELIPVEEACEKIAAKVWIDIDRAEITEEKISALRMLLENYRGKSPVYVSLTTDNGYKVAMVASKKLAVKPDVEFCNRLEGLVGAEKFELRRA
ncbi:DNA polymerase III subunit alpha [Anaerohalosphaera lusitana]|uniref:DNA polymerase III subunit alpha n=1 Tax=Anaerohalosphaera lusitana TaxID=1936003 RepID=A0A1U9NIB7_9BACT|nr:DNA polymerase III subunit alpha [Anaerohalosphaera lusitana]AQT67565.1 DNA polymerase III subunit alpha [Anaerohalosphaera lusitana]